MRAELRGCGPELTQELAEIRVRPGDEPRRIGERFSDAAELVREVGPTGVVLRLAFRLVEVAPRGGGDAAAR